MKPSVWEYLAPDKQTSHFRGYVKVYEGQTITRVPCDKVRLNKLQAKADSQKLLKKLKDNHE